MNNFELNKKVLNKFEMKMSISNFRKEIDMEKSKNKPKNIKYNINKIAASIIMVFVLTGATYATSKIILDKFENREVGYSLGSVKEAIDNGYIENISMEYAYSNFIGVKVNSLLISDNDFNLTLDFNFLKSDVPESIFVFGYTIYDENNNVYYSSTDNLKEKNSKLKKFYKEKKIKYNKNDLLANFYSNSASVNPITYTENRVITEVSLKAMKEFPKSKKLYIKIHDLGYLDDLGFSSITKSEWNLEVDIPDKFDNRYSVEYTIKEDIDNFKLIKAYISETSMTIIAKTDDLESLLNKIKITDEFGKEYHAATESSVIYENAFIATYSLNKDSIPEKLYMKVNIYGQEKIVELIKK